MTTHPKKSLSKVIKDTVIGKAKSPLDKGVFHHLSLIAFFAWVGLGADGLSSSCYGPEEAFLALGSHHYLSLFVAMATALTILVISASYSQIIELFPSGGGGYLVASKLLSPGVGMVSGCALLIDYILTITISVASGADAIFSFMGPEWQSYKIAFAIGGIILLMVMNLRGVKESVTVLMPIFLVFVFSHAFIIIYALCNHASGFSAVAASTINDVKTSHAEMGTVAMLFLILKAYSMGAGTFTGIEAVSNGLPILREPKVKTGIKTMRYMSISLAVTVAGLMIAYLLLGVQHQEGKTLNAVLLETATQGWGNSGAIFVFITLLSEAMLLLVAAQAGFLDGPRVLSSMALDRWFPTKFASLSDRLVSQNGILLMGISALLTLLLTHGSVRFLVVLYSINVFITFCLSQLGMVTYWWGARKNNKKWLSKIWINGIGLLLTTFILISVVIIKFHEGGWITIVITGALVALAVSIKKHYLQTANLLRRLSGLLQQSVNISLKHDPQAAKPELDTKSKTAVILVNGFNGLGLHTLFNVIRLFSKEFKNFAFVQIGVVDAGNFKGADEIEKLKSQTNHDVQRYVDFMNAQGFYAKGFCFVGIDVIVEAETAALEIVAKYPNAVFFGGQLVFPSESIWTKWLHNHTVFTLQRRFYQQGIPFVILPIRVQD